MCARRIVLDIARVEMVRQVEDRSANACAFSAEARNEVRDFEVFRDLQVQRNVSRKTPCTISRANKLKPLVDERERKARTNLYRRRNYQTEARLYLAVG